MEFFNATNYKADYAAGILPNGRTCLVLAVKATFDIVENRKTPVLSEKQVDIFDSDGFSGEPGLSSPAYENDFATHKPKCDVLIFGKAYVPEGRAQKRMHVAARVDKMIKSFRVVGKRTWEKFGPFLYATEPEEFTEQELNWEIAYGGIDGQYHDDDGIEAFMANPVGTGYWKKAKTKYAKDTELARTEEIDQPIENPNQEYAPQGLGPIGRNWHPRVKYGGTYDDNWAQNVKPLPPDDFDERFYQCAPEDQQIDYPQGGEEVAISGMDPDGLINFRLPEFKVPMEVVMANDERRALSPNIDMVVIDCEKKRLIMVSKARLGLRRDIHEVKLLIAGKPTPGWERAWMMDKPYWDLRELNKIRKMFKKIQAKGKE